MTSSRRRASADFVSNSDQVSVTVDVETRLMQNYRVASPVHSGAQTVPVRNRDGLIEFFTLSADGTVWCFEPDTEAGYRGVNTGYPADVFNVAYDADGTLVLLFARGLELYYVTKRRGQDGWGQPASISYPIPPGESARKIEKIILGNIGGQIYVGLLVRFSDASGDLFQLVYSIWSGENPQIWGSDDSHFELASGMALDSVNCVWLGTDAKSATFACVNNTVVNYEISSGERVQQKADRKTSSVAVTATCLPGWQRIFAVLEADKGVYEFSPGTDGAPGTWIPVATNTSYRSVVAVLDGAGLTHLFAVDQSNKLTHWEPDPKKPSQFDSGTVVDTKVALVAAPITSGLVCLAVVGTTQEMLSLLYREETSTTWENQRIEIPDSTDLDEFTSYASDVVLYDEQGAVLVGTPIELSVSDTASMRVNGGVYAVDPDAPLRLTTNAAGTLSISQETATMSIPVVGIRVPELMSEGQTVILDQSAGIGHQLATVSGQELLDAKTNDGAPLLDSQYCTPQTADSLAAALTSCMSLQKATLSRVRPLPGLIRSNHGIGLAHTGSLRDLRTLAIPDGFTPWRLSRTNDGLEYRELDRDEAALLVAQRVDELPSILGVLDWIGDIGDFLAGVAGKTIEVIDTVVQAAEDQIVATITAVLEGANYVYQAVIKTVEESFDLAQVVLAKVEVFFDKIFRWLGFLFEWDDILRTHNAVSYLLEQLGPFLDGVVDGLQQRVDDTLRQVQSSVDTWFDQAEKIFGNSSLGGYPKENQPAKTPDLEKMAAASANTVVSNAVFDHIDAASHTGRLWSLDGAHQRDLDNAVEQLTQAAETAEATPACKAAQNWTATAASQRDGIFHSTIDSLTALLRDLVKAVLSGMRTAIVAVLQAMRAVIAAMTQLLTTTWNIPLLTPLYKKITNGSDLSMTDVIALMVAVPMTVGYKAVTGKSPFPDDASVVAFKGSFNASSMIQASGLGAGHEDNRANLSPILPPDMQFLVVGFGVVASQLGVTATSAIINFDEEISAFLSYINVICEAANFLCSFPWFVLPKSPGSENDIVQWWLISLVVLILDAVGVYKSGRPVQRWSVVGPVCMFIFGTVQLCIGIRASTEIGLKPLEIVPLVALPVNEVIKICNLPPIRHGNPEIGPVLAACDAVFGVSTAMCIQWASFLAWTDQLN